MRTISSACPKCGSIKKSGKSSCCGRGGSWFKNCGSGGNVKLHHTWYEGIQVCKARTQSRTVFGQQPNSAQYNSMDSSNRDVMINGTANSKGITTSDLASTSTTLTSISMSYLSHTSVSASIITRGFETLLKIITTVSVFY